MRTQVQCTRKVYEETPATNKIEAKKKIIGLKLEHSTINFQVQRTQKVFKSKIHKLDKKMLPTMT